MKKTIFAVIVIGELLFCSLLSAADDEWKEQKVLYEAILKNDTKAVEAILEKNPSFANKQIKYHNLPILDAAQAGALNVLKVLVEKGADIKKLEPETGNTALHIASTCRSLNKENREALYDYLINEKKINVNTKNKDGVTPFLYSFTFSRFAPPIKLGLDNIEVFGKFKADLDAQDKAGKTALNFLVTSFQIRDPATPNFKTLDMAKALIEKGADVNIADNNKRTPLVSFLLHTQKVDDAKKIDFVTVLMENGAKTNIKSKKKEQALKLVDKKSELYQVLKKKYKQK